MGIVSEVAGENVERALGKILVVDDQRSMRATLSMLLRSNGYEVDEADSGETGQEMGAAGAYDLVLRLDPIAANSPEQVDVLFNRHLVGRLTPTTDPERVGSYRLRLREDIVNAGSNEIILVPSSMTPAASAGPRFAWLDPAERLGVRLWYVRILP